jgi:hypothetical protein
MTSRLAAAGSRAAAVRLVADFQVLANPSSAGVAVIGLGNVGMPLLAGFAYATDQSYLTLTRAR